MQLPQWPPEGRKGSETPASLLFDQDLVVYLATYMRVYTVNIKTKLIKTRHGN